MQHQSSATRARHAEHECGCLIEYVTDRLGEYPQSVEGCSINEQITARLLSGELSDSAYLVAIKGHRGRELR
jgi:hypothetical protein